MTEKRQPKGWYGLQTEHACSRFPVFSGVNDGYLQWVWSPISCMRYRIRPALLLQVGGIFRDEELIFWLYKDVHGTLILACNLNVRTTPHPTFHRVSRSIPFRHTKHESHVPSKGTLTAPIPPKNSINTQIKAPTMPPTRLAMVVLLSNTRKQLQPNLLCSARLAKLYHNSQYTPLVPVVSELAYQKTTIWGQSTVRGSPGKMARTRHWSPERWDQKSQ